MKVSLISLNLNGMHFIDAFLDSVRVELDDFPSSELILLDNGSTDNSVSHILDNYRWVRLIQSPRNIGFTRGCHHAASQSDAEFLVFLNNDMKLEPGFLHEIIEPLEDDDSIGVSAALILSSSGTQIDYGGGTANAFGWGFQRYHKEFVSTIEDLIKEDTFPLQFFPCGGAFAIRKSVWELSGGFDPDYFAFFEDVDLGWRLNMMGLRTVLVPKARTLHRHHGTASSMSAQLRMYLLERNALASVIKNYDDPSLGQILPWAIAMMNERALVSLSVDKDSIFRGRWAEDIWRSVDENYISEDEKESKLKRVGKALKETITQTSKTPIQQLAIEEIFNSWDKLMIKRSEIQSKRKIPDTQIWSLMGEPFRTVLGHTREKELMEIFRRNVQF